MRLELFLALALVGWFAAPSLAQDPSVEDSALANRAVAQFKTIWSNNKTLVEALRDRELDEKKSLERLIEKAGLPKMQACPDQDKTANERAISIKLRGIEAAWESAATSEADEYKSRLREFNESVSSNEPYATRFSLSDKVVWSRARAQMLLFLGPIFGEEFRRWSSLIQLHVPLERYFHPSGLARRKFWTCCVQRHHVR